METTKKCRSCKLLKKKEYFNNSKSNKDGLNAICKECSRLAYNKFSKSKEGFFTISYKNQIRSSKARGHNLPNYTKDELKEKYINTNIFLSLYKEWEDNGFCKDLSPSFDRKDDTKSYSFENIRLVTWKVNKNKAMRDIRTGKNKHGYNPQKKVYQFTRQGKFLKDFVSSNEAKRKTGIDHGAICGCCRGLRKSAGGFIWRYSKKFELERS